MVADFVKLVVGSNPSDGLLVVELLDFRPVLEVVLTVGGVMVATLVLGTSALCVWVRVPPDRLLVRRKTIIKTRLKFVGVVKTYNPSYCISGT